jgi:apolipoprotein N-acyltransferase
LCDTPDDRTGRALFQFASQTDFGYLPRVTNRRDSAIRWLLALGSGVALGLSFPQPGWAGLAWVAPVGLLFAAAGLKGAEAFRLGYAGGLAAHLTALGWLLHIPFPIGNAAGWLALSGYLALYQGLWVWLCTRWSGLPADRTSSWHATLDRLLAGPGWRRAIWALFCAAAWVALEMVQARLFTGFPWNLLGTSQFRLIPVIQVAAYTGVYGVSFLIVWTSVCLGLALIRVARQPTARWGWMVDVRLPLLVVVALGSAGMYRMNVHPFDPPGIRIALIQPSIPQELIWDDRQDAYRFQALMRMSELALSTRPDLLVWPEAAFPAVTAERYQAVTNLVMSGEIYMVFGADDAEPIETGGDDPEYRHFNAAFLMDPSGQMTGVYRKRRLVVFGEYVPLARWLPFLRHFTPIQGSFTPGDGPEVFELRDPRVKLSVLICFEDVFPHLSREHARQGVDLLLNLTNNGWFGESSAQWQHAAAAVFRAVENGRPLVRATNNGLTCWIDPNGRIRDWLGQDDSDIYGVGFITVSVPLPPADRAETYYFRVGDRFGWACVAVSLVGLVLGCCRRWWDARHRPKA